MDSYASDMAGLMTVGAHWLEMYLREILAVRAAVDVGRACELWIRKEHELYERYSMVEALYISDHWRSEDALVFDKS